MDTLETVAYLLETTCDKRPPGEDDGMEARELAHSLGGLALALEQAAAFITRKKTAWPSIENGGRTRKRR